MKCPFTGKICLKTKDIYVTQIVDGKSQQLFLCEECGLEYIKSLEQDSTTKVKHSLEVISEAGSTEITNEVSEDTVDSSCPECGLTIEDIEAGKPACSTCTEYHDIFKLMSDEEEPKLPINYVLIKEIEELEARLEECIEIEWYEEAAKISDKLKNLRENK